MLGSEGLGQSKWAARTSLPKVGGQRQQMLGRGTRQAEPGSPSERLGPGMYPRETRAGRLCSRFSPGDRGLAWTSCQNAWLGSGCGLAGRFTGSPQFRVLLVHGAGIETTGLTKAPACPSKAASRCSDRCAPGFCCPASCSFSAKVMLRGSSAHRACLHVYIFLFQCIYVVCESVHIHVSRCGSMCKCVLCAHVLHVLFLCYVCSYFSVNMLPFCFSVHMYMCCVFIFLCMYVVCSYVCVPVCLCYVCSCSLCTCMCLCFYAYVCMQGYRAAHAKPWCSHLPACSPDTGSGQALCPSQLSPRGMIPSCGAVRRMPLTVGGSKGPAKLRVGRLYP